MALDWRRFVDTNPANLMPVPHWARFLIEMIGAIMTAQDDINNAVTAIAAVLTDVQADVATLGADLQAWIAAQPPAVDTSGLQSLVTNAQSAQAALDTQVQAITTAVNPPSA